MGLTHKFTAPDGTTRTLPITTQGAESFVGNLEGRGRGSGGFMSATGTISEDEFDAWAGWQQYGIWWRIFADDVANPIFTGQLRDLIPAGGVATLAADGVATKAEKTFEYWLWLTRLLDRWTQMDAEPFDYFVDPEIEAEAKGREIRFRVERGTPFVRRDGRDKLKSDANSGTSQIVIAHNDGGLDQGETIWIAGDPYTVHTSYSPGDTTIPLTSNLTRDYGKDAPVRWLVAADSHVWRAGLVFPAPLTDLNRFAARLAFPHGHDSAYTLELLRATFPSGNLTLVQSWGLGNTAPRKIDVAVSANPDMLIVRVKRQSTTRKAHGFALVMRDVVVGSMATVDDYKTHQVATDVFNKMGVTPIVQASTQNAMPFEASEGSAGSVLDENGLLDDWPWLVEDSSVITDIWPVLVGRYRPWTARTWKVIEPEFPFVPVPLPRFDKARCPYRYPGGFKDYVTKTANPNPCPGAGTIDIPLQDPLPSEVVAGVLAQNVANRLSTKRTGGEITFTEVEDNAVPGVKVPGHAVRGGDTLILTQYGNLNGLTQDVSFDDAVLTARFPEQIPMLDVILRKRGRLLALGRSNAEATLRGLGIREPAQVSLASMTPAARVKRKRGGRRDYDVVLPWNPVIEDVAGNATALKSYVVRWQYCDAAGTQISTSIAGKTRQVVVRDKEDGDVDGFPPTEVIVKDIEHPGTWRIKYKVAAIDILDRQGAFSAWSAPFLPQSTAPPMPTTATLRWTRHGFELTWDSARDPDDSTQPDPAIHHFHWRLKNPSAAVVREGDTRDFQKTLPLKKPATGSWTLEVRSHDGNGGFSAYRTASRTIRKPGRIRNRSLTRKGRTLRGKFDLPNQWDDGSTDDWDESEVMDTKIEIWRGGAVQDTLLTRANNFEYTLTKAQAELTGWNFKGFARGWDELDSGADAETGNVTPAPLDITDRDIKDLAVSFNSLALESLSNGLDDPSFERDTTPTDSDGNAIPYESAWEYDGADATPIQDGTHARAGGVGYFRVTVPAGSMVKALKNKAKIAARNGDWIYFAGFAKCIGVPQGGQVVQVAVRMYDVNGNSLGDYSQLVSLVANAHTGVDSLRKIANSQVAYVQYIVFLDTAGASQPMDVAIDDTYCAVVPRWTTPDTYHAYEATNESRTNTAYGDLTTAGPVVGFVAPPSGMVKATWGAQMANATAGGDAAMSLELFNDTTDVVALSPSDSYMAKHGATTYTTCSRTHVFSGLNSGHSYILRSKYKSAAGNAANFAGRYLIVEPV